MITDLRRFKRNRFFTGRLLTPGDFTREQDYFGEKQKRHNRYLHGFGVVVGLEISKRHDQVVMSAGWAFDCSGNEIVVPESTTFLLPAPNHLENSIFLTLRYVELTGDQFPYLVTIPRLRIRQLKKPNVYRYTGERKERAP